MRGQVDSYSMLICSKYVKTIKDMINITLVNSKFRETIDKFHFNPFQINQKTRKYFSHLQTQWLYGDLDEMFKNDGISGYYVYHEIFYDKYLTMIDKYQNMTFRRIIYIENDKYKYGDEIPNVVSKLGYGVYEYFNLNIKEIVIPDSIVEISGNCFNACQSLTSVTVSSRLTKIGEYAFRYCEELSSITLPSVLTSLNKGVFEYCSKLTTIEYSPFVVDLNDNLFSGNGFSTITIPTSITRIGDECFSGCQLTSLKIPSHVIHFGKYVFSDNEELQEVELPNNMMELPRGMFSGCSNLTKINIPSSITKIGDDCFSECSSLKEINIPMSVIEIGGYAFGDCLELQSIKGNVDVCKKYKDCFENTPFFDEIELEQQINIK